MDTATMNLWIFGPSSCLAHRVEPNAAWPNILAGHFDLDLKNFAANACDNFYIYQRFLENLPSIKAQDLVIIGWSHPFRKCFVYDDQNPFHQRIKRQNIMIYPGATVMFRSNTASKDNKEKWLSMLPFNQGNDFFDTWFENYWHPVECRSNFQAYIDSVRLRCPAGLLDFYTNRDSVTGIQTSLDPMFFIEFVEQTGTAISQDDIHPNEIGHRLLAEFFIEKIEKL